MKKFVTAGIILLTIVACDKEKFQTKPTLEVTSVSNEVVPVNGSLEIVLKFTDKEGDVSDSLFLRKTRLNRRVVATLRDAFGFKIPAFPNATQGEFSILLAYQNIISAQNPPNIPGSVPSRRESDTLNLKIAVQDKAGNTSDTVTINNIVVQR